jgi:hypothetical protein
MRPLLISKSSGNFALFIEWGSSSPPVEAMEKLQRVNFSNAEIFHEIT